MLCKKKIYVLFFAASLLLCLYAASFCRLARWQNAPVCVADIFCMITTPREYLYLIYLVFGLMQYGDCRFYLLPAYTLKAKSRRNIVKHQICHAIQGALGLAAWIAATAAAISVFVAEEAINWDQYESLYYLNTQTLRHESLGTVIVLSVVYIFFTLIVVALLFAISAWLVSSAWVGGLSFTLLYLWDTAQSYDHSMFFRRFSLQYDSWSTNMPRLTVLVVHPLVVLLLISSVYVLSKKKDLIKSC